jgi:5-methylcytosine-specific restriction endonuclease McrA
MSAFSDVEGNSNVRDDETVEEIVDRAKYEYDLTIGQLSEEYNMKPLDVAEIIEDNVRYSALKETTYTFSAHRHPSVLEQLHHHEMMGVDDMADRLEVNRSTVIDWMEKQDVERRTRHSQKWVGTTSWDDVADEIRKKDNNECVVCGISNHSHNKKYGKDLNVHHVIEEDAFESDDLAADPQNLVTLCVECHRVYEGRTPRHMFYSAYGDSDD